MNTGYFRKDKIYKDVGGVITQIFDFASQPSITPAQLALATGMSLTRATELINERTVFNSTNCPLSSVSNINFVSATYSVVEPDSGVSVVDVVLRRTNGCDGSITVTIDRIGGTASPVNDFINIFPITQTWLDQDCTDKTIQVSIVGDTINEPGVAETIILEISNPIGNGIIGTLNQTTISITDNDLAYIVNTQVSSTSNCLATGSVTYPISSNVLGGSNYNVPVNLNGCNLTAILVNGVNVSTLELNNARATGIHPLLNVQSNITVELVYQSAGVGAIQTMFITNETNNSFDLNNESSITFTHKGGTFSYAVTPIFGNTYADKNLAIYNQLLLDINFTTYYNVVIDSIPGVYSQILITSKPTFLGDFSYKMTVIAPTYRLNTYNVQQGAGGFVIQQSFTGQQNTLIGRSGIFSYW